MIRGYGQTVHKDVLVYWDEDHDERIISFLDNLDSSIRMKLIAVQEHEGCLSLIWKHSIPEPFLRENQLDVEGDVWTIVSSSIAPQE